MTLDDKLRAAHEAGAIVMCEPVTRDPRHANPDSKSHAYRVEIITEKIERLARELEREREREASLEAELRAICSVAPPGAKASSGRSRR